MQTYLVTWNPNRWEWDPAEDVRALRRRGYWDGRWSCGRSKRIAPGDRLFLLRQGVEPRGIMASGTALSSSYPDDHWDSNVGGEALYVDIRYDALVSPETDGVLTLDALRTGGVVGVHWRTQASGISVHPSAAAKIEDLWRAFLAEHGQAPIRLPEEVGTPALYSEGAVSRVHVNAFERDPRARKACIAHYGSRCSVCGFDFGVRYGSRGQGYIHVHHLKPLAEIRERYVLDPVRDLRPVCPNCHAMLHHGDEVLTISQLRRLLKRASRPTTRCT